MRQAGSTGRSGIARDVMAGLTLAAITIPEQMATARLGGFEPQVGFYAFVGATLGFAIVALLAAGANRILTAGADSTITPIFTATVAGLAASGVAGQPQAAMTLALLVAAVLLIAGLLRLGWIADLLSTPIVTGFLLGIAAHIVASQLPDVMGLEAPNDNMIHRLSVLARTAGNSNPWSVAIGFGVLALVLVGEKINPRWPGALIAMALATAAVLAFRLEHRGVAVLGRLPGGLPTPIAPALSFDSLRELVPLALIVALIVMMQTAAVSRSFGDGNANVNRDYLGLALGNLGAALLGAFPVNASPPRTAVVREAGGTSQMVALVAAAVVAALALAGGGLLAHVPQAALAGVLLFVALRIVRADVIASVARQAPGEAALIGLTAVAVIALPIPTGVAIGIGLSLLHGVWIATQTRVIEFRHLPDTTIWWPAHVSTKGETVEGVLVAGFSASLVFSNAEPFRRGMEAAITARSAVRLVVLEAGGIATVDYTAAQALRSLIESCRTRDITFAIARLESVRARDALEKFNVLATLGPDRLFMSVAEAVAAIPVAPDKISGTPPR
jgi:MFS superfamily sulfate permease-like transporter